MRKIGFLILLCLPILGFGQDKTSVAIAAEIANPFGKFSENFGLGYGASFKVAIPMKIENVYADIHVGFLNFSSKNKNSDLNLSYNSTFVKAGLGYHLSDILYINTQIGASFLNRGLGTAFIVTPSFGGIFAISEKLKGDVSLRYESWFSHPNISFAALRLGIVF